MLVESQAMKLLSTGGIEPLYSGAHTMIPEACSTLSAASSKRSMSGFVFSNFAVYNGKSSSSRWMVVDCAPASAMHRSNSSASTTFLPDDATRIVICFTEVVHDHPFFKSRYQIDYHWIL